MSRLSETFQFVLDVMGCSVSTLPSGPTAGTQAKHTQHEDHRNREIAYLLPGGEGWKSAVRVRLLHGIARWRTEERWERGENAQPGVPISQEDMAATCVTSVCTPLRQPK